MGWVGSKSSDDSSMSKKKIGGVCRSGGEGGERARAERDIDR